MLVGLFDDWRTGMETFGDVNALIAPKREWNNPTPFGWNSWGGMERNINFDGVISVSDFIKENIQGKGSFRRRRTCFRRTGLFLGQSELGAIETICRLL